MQLPAGNIWSGSRMLAVLTAPTELARKKGNLRKSYPVKAFDQEWPDVEKAYQTLKKGSDLERAALMTHLLYVRFEQYPQIGEAVRDSGGVAWLEECSHIVMGKVRWEGVGRQSRFIRCLIEAYEMWYAEVHV